MKRLDFAIDRKRDIRCIKLELLRKHIISEKNDDSDVEASGTQKSEEEKDRITQNRFARLIQVDPANYSKYEAGKKIPSYQILSRIAAQCKVELEYFANKQGPSDALKFYEWRDWFYRLYKTNDGAEIFNAIPVATEALELKDRVNQKNRVTEHQISEELFEAKAKD